MYAQPWNVPARETVHILLLFVLSALPLGLEGDHGDTIYTYCWTILFWVSSSRIRFKYRYCTRLIGNQEDSVLQTLCASNIGVSRDTCTNRQV